MFEMPSLTSNPVIDRISEQHLGRCHGRGQTWCAQKHKPKKSAERFTCSRRCLSENGGRAPFEESKPSPWFEMTEILPPSTRLTCCCCQHCRPPLPPAPEPLEFLVNQTKKPHDWSAASKRDCKTLWPALAPIITSDHSCLMLPLDFWVPERRTENNVLISIEGDGQRRCFLIDFITVVSTGEALFLWCAHLDSYKHFTFWFRLVTLPHYLNVLYFLHFCWLTVSFFDIWCCSSGIL